MKKKIEVIAEIGVNHNGNLAKAKILIEEAKKAGADYVKFQYYKSHLLSTGYAKKAKYQIQKNNKKTQLQMLKKYELNLNQMKELKISHQKKN